ncbi:hypothetical protein JL101_017160 [Skermanella rosea]|uniref:hypothetical protein n=1 Tax=Skermanella rosea TaxID=1817965 RepID=UPI001932B5B0|nr:hypothetical protein [Skermanella rosea]UEM01728.1 hypothetical protein JL101_017160 [Skermanella rosea]
MTDLLQPATAEAPFDWHFPVRPGWENGTDTLSRPADDEPARCWKAVLADLLDQALTVDAFTETARQAFGEDCTVVPPGGGLSMQQFTPPRRIVITNMVDDMVTGAACY